MTIGIYAEPLRSVTTGTPMRNMLVELLRLRNKDRFIFIVREGHDQDQVLCAFFDHLKLFSNWELAIEKRSRRMSNLLGLLRYPNYCAVHAKAQVYFNPDGNSLGKRAHPLIVTIHDLSSFQGLQFTSYRYQWQLWLRRFMLANGIRKADHVVAISKYTKQETVSRFPVAADKTTVIYNGLGDDWFTENAVTAANGQQPYWIWWGMITPRKNMANLLKAYARLKKNDTKAPALRLIYSNQEFPPELLQLIREEGIADQVIRERRKTLPELIGIVSQSNGLIFPSFIEGFGMPVLESYSRGIPVLTSGTTSLEEVAGGLGILVDPANEADVLEGLKKLQEPANQLPAAVEARKSWASGFTAAKAANQYSHLIDTYKPQ